MSLLDKTNALLLRAFSVFSVGENLDMGIYGYHNRRWAWAPSIFASHKCVAFTFGCFLIQYDGKPCEKQGYYVSIQIRREFKFRIEHLYYDGPNCFYQFGPFAFAKQLNWCKKCMPDDS